MSATVCRYCGRPLSTAKSIMAGAGPKCLAQHGQQIDLFTGEPMRRVRTHNTQPRRLRIKLTAWGIIRAVFTGKIRSSI